MPIASACFWSSRIALGCCGTKRVKRCGPGPGDHVQRFGRHASRQVGIVQCQPDTPHERQPVRNRMSRTFTLYYLRSIDNYLHNNVLLTS